MKTNKFFTASLFFALIFLLSSNFASAQNPDWNTGGNSGSNPNIFGTTDNRSVRIKTNNVNRGVIDSTGLVGIGTITPSFKFHLVNGSDEGENLGYEACGVHAYPDNSYGVFSITKTGTGFNQGVAGFAFDDDSRNAGGFFRAAGNLIASTDCIFNVGVDCAASGDGLNEDSVILNVGVAGWATGEEAENFGGGFMGLNTGCTGLTTGITAEASGGSQIAGIYATAYNDSLCVTDSITVSGGGKVASVFAAYFDGHVFRTGNEYTPSDERLKQNINPVLNASELLSKLQVMNYTFNQKEFPSLQLPDGNHYGVLAQQTEEVLPDMVVNMQTITPRNFKTGVKKESYQIKAVNYDEFIPLLIAAHNEQRAEIDQLRLLLEQVCKSGCDKVNFTNTIDQGYYLNTFPNPADNTLQVNYSIISADETVEVELTDLSGKLHKLHTFGKEARGNATIDVSQLPAGNYHVTLKANGVILKTNMVSIVR